MKRKISRYEFQVSSVSLLNYFSKTDNPFLKIIRSSSIKYLFNLILKINNYEIGFGFSVILLSKILLSFSNSNKFRNIFILRKRRWSMSIILYTSPPKKCWETCKLNLKRETKISPFF